MHLVLSVCQESPRCFKEGVCGGDGVCSLPGRRAGHASSSFFYQGGPSVLLLYGGEIHKNETSTERQLTNDIVTGWFDGSSITWARMNLDCPQSWSCPEPRRDMSISIIDSRGDSRLRICVCVLKIYKFQSVRVCKRQNLESNDHIWTIARTKCGRMYVGRRYLRSAQPQPLVSWKPCIPKARCFCPPK